MLVRQQLAGPPPSLAGPPSHQLPADSSKNIESAPKSILPHTNGHGQEGVRVQGGGGGGAGGAGGGGGTKIMFISRELLVLGRETETLLAGGGGG